MKKYWIHAKSIESGDYKLISTVTAKNKKEAIMKAIIHDESGLLGFTHSTYGIWAEIPFEKKTINLSGMANY